MKQHSYPTLILLIIPLFMACGPIGALRPATPTPQVPLEELLIDKTVYPMWEQPYADDPGGVSNDFSGGNDLENIVRQFYYKEIVSTHILWRYRSYDDAHKKYESILSQYGGYDLTNTKGISYTNTVTPEITLFCSEKEGTATILCHAIARYGVYISEFSTHVDHENMTYEDFERILTEIDRKMSAVVDK